MVDQEPLTENTRNDSNVFSTMKMLCYNNLHCEMTMSYTKYINIMATV